MCVWVCVSMCLYICVCPRLCICVYLCLNSVCMSVCLYVCLCLYVCVCMCLCIYTYVSVCVSICVSVFCVCVCVFSVCVAMCVSMFISSGVLKDPLSLGPSLLSCHDFCTLPSFLSSSCRMRGIFSLIASFIYCHFLFSLLHLKSKHVEHFVSPITKLK